MLRVVIAFLVGLAALPALAADRLSIGPAPLWVKPLEVKAPAIGQDGAAVRLVLQDRQLNFTPQGDSEYVAQVVQIRTPQGLAAAGTLSLAWNPDVDAVIVHHARILRGEQVIDLLTRQSFSVLRRETNLERAMVDGVLTATLQPEGLQVGDLVDLAYTVTRLDPVLSGRSERSAALAPFGKADRLRLRATWDAKRPLQWRASAGLDKPRVTTSGGRVEVAVDLTDPAPLKYSLSAPARFLPTRELTVSQFKSWTEVSSLMAPHYARAAVLKPDSPLKAEISRIRAASSDPKVQAAAALRLVEDQVRYLALVLNFGGYIPAEADQTWARRYGDCKAKTVLLMALLHELEIQAEAALVHSTRGDGLETRLPGLGAFEHVIVRAVVAGKVYWMDPTRTGDRSLSGLRIPPFHWALPLRDSGGDLVSLEQPPLTAPDNVMRLTIDASAGLDAPAPTRGEMTLSPMISQYIAMATANLSSADHDKLLREMWSTYPWIAVKSVTSKVSDDGFVRVQMDGTARLPFERQSLGRALRIRGSDLGGLGRLERPADDPLPDAPFLVAGYPGYEAFSLALTLPDGGEGFTVEGADVDLKVAGRALMRKSRINHGVATIETSHRSLVPELSAAEVKAAKAAMEEVAKVRVLVRAPLNYQLTDEDVVAWRSQTPQDLQAFLERGNLYMDSGKIDLALADFNKAVELDASSGFGLANRALAHVNGGKIDAAKADAAQALVLNPRNYVALHGMGMIAMREGRYADAALAFGRAADLRAGNRFALTGQAHAYQAMDEMEKALAVTAELERLYPDRPEARRLRYEIYANAGQRERALAELDQLLAKAPDDADLHLNRASILALIGRREEAEKAFARTLQIRPSIGAYLTRAARREPGDVAGKLADIAAAEALEPGLPGITARRAVILAEAGRLDEGLAILDGALKAHPGDAPLLLARADIHARAGRAALAGKDFAAIRTKAASAPDQLNGLCWQQAIRNFALETALADCDAALKIAPSHANAVDSRAFVLMRLGRLDEALATYDTALRLRPRQAESLFGRGLTRLRLNQALQGHVDLAAARAADPGVDATFAGYGLLPPTPAAAPQPST